MNYTVELIVDHVVCYAKLLPIGQKGEEMKKAIAVLNRLRCMKGGDECNPPFKKICSEIEDRLKDVCAPLH